MAKKLFYITLGGDSAGLLLEGDIYDTIAGSLGLTTAAPAGGNAPIQSTLAQVLRTGKATRLQLSCRDTATGKRRNVRVVCENAQVAAALGALPSKTVKLGAGTNNKTWDVVAARIYNPRKLVLV